MSGRLHADGRPSGDGALQLLLQQRVFEAVHQCLKAAFDTTVVDADCAPFRVAVSRLDEMDTEDVETFGNPQLIGPAKSNTFALRSVAERCVVDLYELCHEGIFILYLELAP